MMMVVVTMMILMMMTVVIVMMTINQAMAKRNATIEEGAEASCKLLADRAQEVADLTSKASAETAAANKALAELEALRAEDKREARKQLAAKAEEVAKAAAATRDSEERRAEDAGERERECVDCLPYYCGTVREEFL